MTHVPFRGSGEAMPALLAGDVDVMFDNLPARIPHIQSGALRALAVTTPERSVSLEGVPTLDELDIPALDGFAARSWLACWRLQVPIPAIMATLSEALDQVIASDAFMAFADPGGADRGRQPPRPSRSISQRNWPTGKRSSTKRA
ncbi:MAG: tripartite tricarboxylate transporter substrate-binding protein [Trueperaceae bacterium]|nr:tripartite tricarboxylate transporter substrate-binding protein [Trueperaceae bacterium]